MEAKERLVLSEHDSGTAPVGVPWGLTPTRARADFEGLLQLAEKLQQSLNKNVEALRRSQNIGHLGLVSLTLGFAWIILNAIPLLLHAAKVHDHPVPFGDVLVSTIPFLCVGGGGWLLWLSIPRLNHLRREIRYDERDITEVVELLREIEPIFAAQEDLSALERIGIRIRLSRFGIGPSVREEARRQERTEARPRNSRADQVAKPL